MTQKLLDNKEHVLFACAQHQNYRAVATFNSQSDNNVFIYKDNELVFTSDNLFFPVFSLKFIEINQCIFLFICTDNVRVIMVSQIIRQIKIFAPALYFDGILQIEFFNQVQNNKIEDKVMLRTGDGRICIFLIQQNFEIVQEINYKGFASDLCMFSMGSIVTFGIVSSDNQPQPKFFFQVCRYIFGDKSISTIGNRVPLQYQPDKILLDHRTLDMPQTEIFGFELYTLNLDSIKRLIFSQAQQQYVVEEQLLFNGGYNNFVLRNNKLILTGSQTIAFYEVDQNSNQYCQIINEKKIDFEGENIADGQELMIVGNKGIALVDEMQ
ncbi:Conserved_hypothetical protein [Hexamita inflata]|uniref:Uncharacterized protein n=1 Tax=Hexamita inflata TaxID=28002 RepID=A0AA86RMZ0_9EUKA|nr:Conserved hypothetical protein [Hexamita inflata]